MSSDEQWRDAYGIAEKMYNEIRSMKRSELDIYSQIVCARYDSVFCYDPYKDEYSFRNQSLKIGDPVPSKCRRIADIDLEAMRKNTLSVGIQEPGYINLTPIHVAPPSTILVFNHSQPRAPGLTDALDRVSSTLTARASERDIQPGAEFLYKHRDQKCYRVLILSEVDGESPISDPERRYEVVFLDVCQVITLKLKSLFLPIAELSLDRFPCVLQCTRLVGVKSMRSGYIPAYIDQMRRLYADKELRRTGMSAIVYKTDKSEQKMIVDFASFLGGECTESSALVAVHGYHSTTDDDPIPLDYQQLKEKVVLPLQYKRHDEGDCLNDSDFANLSTISSKTRDPIDCPFKPDNMEEFLKPDDPRAESSNYETMEESIPSFRSNAITPKPTYDLPIESTPTKVEKKGFGGDGSPDGWEETPKKHKEVVEKTLLAPKAVTSQESMPGPSCLSTVNLSIDSPTCSIPIIETEHQTPPRTTATPDVVEESPQNVTVLEKKTTPWQTPKKEEPTTPKKEEPTTPRSTNSAMIREVQEKFNDEDDGWADDEKKSSEEIQKADDEKKSSEEIQKADDEKKMREVLGEALKKHKENKMENLKERIREHFKSTSTVSAPDDIVSPPEVTDGVSVQSLCPTASESSEQVFTRDDPIDEFANVPESLKQLADSFISSVQESAMNKNRPHFISDVFTMEMIALKSSGDLEQRFWKQKIQEAKGLDPAFD